MPARHEAAALLRWLIEAGADEAIGETPVDRFAALPAHAAPVPSRAPARARSDPGSALPAGNPAISASPAVAASAPGVPVPAAPMEASRVAGRAASEAAQADDMDALRRMVEAFEGCALKATATNTVFCDGNPKARLMLIGEAPGAEEDRRGLPFVGASGRLLDRMLGAIGLDRGGAFITNVIYWRPPGNRTPLPAEVAACLPFVERAIELVDPAVLVLLGGASAKTLLGRQEGIMRLRGRWHAFATPRMARPIPAMATFHPAYLLRSPAQKREAWRDFLAVREKLDAEM